MSTFIEYLDRMIGKGKQEIEELEADGRRDDAVFAKVRTNIYEVCRTVSGALLDRPGAGVKAISSQFARFKTAWGAALEKAKAHGDVNAIAVEETKLAALDDVIAHFSEVNEE